ncbi:MAG: hypothetical protein IKA09_03415 [Lachnospiraceae bacterium]|nr:hypothetical protein [Lachnospiraceae bacterium]
MMKSDRKQIIKGITVCNPVDVDKDYLMFCVDYAAKIGMNHIQIVGPIHDVIRGNIDGMTPYRKYCIFDGEKDSDYVKLCLDAVNEACEKTVKYGIKTYMWHHELELPNAFKEVYPEVVNSCGDIEVTHPLVKDFLENKIIDFFHFYPNIDGLILTLHETKIPLLKLKDQKLGKIERVKYVTQILYDACRSLGKELIVRPFASLEEDYAMMAKAYEEISTELLVMDKWTQFDWSLTLPHNAFFYKIKNNPLFVEGDIFGEFFGKGRLPMMLKNHLAEKYAYCEGFLPKGYVVRVDRSGQSSFGDVNEVNINIANAYLNQKDVDAEINAFFEKKYPNAAKEVRELMEQTEGILIKMLYINGYYFSELSLFPTMSHCKNHYYFEMMREKCDIVSNEWYVPLGWERGALKEILEEKKAATEKAEELYERLLGLKDKIESAEYDKLWVKFCNLKLVTEMWLTLTMIFMDYAQYFETRDDNYTISLEQNLENLLALNKQGTEILGDDFYVMAAKEVLAVDGNVESFVKEIRENFRVEKETVENIEKEDNVLDYVVCGGPMEGHRLLKEVNFSDTKIRNGMLCRIPDNWKGAAWSSINAHGWISYEVRVQPNAVNTFAIMMEGVDEALDVRISIGKKEYLIQEKLNDRKEFMLNYKEELGKTSVRIRFSKLSGHTPCIYTIKVLGK